MVCLLVFILKNEVFAQNTEQKPTNTQNYIITATTSGNTVQNQNQINTQNQGEDSQIEVKNDENEMLEEGDEEGEGLQTRSQTALEHMSNVAKQVQLMLQIRTEGGIGDQVREIAKEQNQSQVQTELDLEKLNGKSKFARFLTGTDFGAVKNIRQQVEQNQLRIQKLLELQNQLNNQADIKTVQESIQSIINQNTSLSELIQAEEQTKSIFGWLIKYFYQ